LLLVSTGFVISYWPFSSFFKLCLNREQRVYVSDIVRLVIVTLQRCFGQNNGFLLFPDEQLDFVQALHNGREMTVAVLLFGCDLHIGKRLVVVVL